MEKAGVSNNYKFHEDLCYNSICYYIQNDIKFDFAYIDSTKLFDWIISDFFLLDKILKDNGIIVFDDACFPSIRKIMRFIAQLPHYSVLNQHPKNKKSSKRQILKSIIKLFPFNKKIFCSELILTDYDLGINSNCIAFKKQHSDNRNYDWHVPF